MEKGAGVLGPRPFPRKVAEYRKIRELPNKGQKTRYLKIGFSVDCCQSLFCICGAIFQRTIFDNTALYIRPVIHTLNSKTIL